MTFQVLKKYGSTLTIEDVNKDIQRMARDSWRVKLLTVDNFCIYVLYELPE